MENRRALAELPVELLPEHGGERDLGDEPDRRPSLFERGRNRAQIDLGLAAAGHALKQRRKIPALVECAANRVERRALLVGQLQNRPALLARNGRRFAWPLPLLDQASLGELVQDAGVGARRRPDLARGRFSPQIRKKGEHVAPPPAATQTFLLFARRERHRLVCLLDAAPPEPARKDDPHPPALLEQTQVICPSGDVEL